jgi:hypothetical protein
MAKSESKKEKTNGWIKVSYFQLALGIILNILTIVVFILLYHAYIVEPQLKSNSFQIDRSDTEIENPTSNTNTPPQNNE